jgi:hypothetical protein
MIETLANLCAAALLEQLNSIVPRLKDLNTSVDSYLDDASGPKTSISSTLPEQFDKTCASLEKSFVKFAERIQLKSTLKSSLVRAQESKPMPSVPKDHHNRAFCPGALYLQNRGCKSADVEHIKDKDKTDKDGSTFICKYCYLDVGISYFIRFSSRGQALQSSPLLAASHVTVSRSINDHSAVYKCPACYFEHEDVDFPSVLAFESHMRLQHPEFEFPNEKSHAQITRRASSLSGLSLAHVQERREKMKEKIFELEGKEISVKPPSDDAPWDTAESPPSPLTNSEITPSTPNAPKSGPSIATPVRLGDYTSSTLTPSLTAERPKYEYSGDLSSVPSNSSHGIEFGRETNPEPPELVGYRRHVSGPQELSGIASMTNHQDRYELQSPPPDFWRSGSHELSSHSPHRGPPSPPHEVADTSRDEAMARELQAEQQCQPYEAYTPYGSQAESNGHASQAQNYAHGSMIRPNATTRFDQSRQRPPLELSTDTDVPVTEYNGHAPDPGVARRSTESLRTQKTSRTREFLKLKKRGP